jgi:hypothetical protein
MRKNLLFTSAIVALLQLNMAALANTVINLSTSHAEGRSGAIPRITIWQGVGLSLNFASTGEKIVKAWLDDPSRLTLDFDVPFCGGEGQRRCSGGATIIHLRRIQGLNFSHLPATSTTLLTVVTEGQGTRKTYYFNVGYGSGRARYIAVNINPDPRPALQQRQRLEREVQARAERIERGLQIARQRNTSENNEKVFERVEILLAHVRGGMSFQEAVRRVNIAPSVLNQLESMATRSGGAN